MEPPIWDHGFHIFVPMAALGQAMELRRRLLEPVGFWPPRVEESATPVGPVGCRGISGAEGGIWVSFGGYRLWLVGDVHINDIII